MHLINTYCKDSFWIFELYVDQTESKNLEKDTVMRDENQTCFYNSSDIIWNIIYR